MERLTAFVLRRRRLVVLLAVAAFLAGLAATPFAVQRFSEDYGHPGVPAFDANREIARLYGNGGAQRPTVVVVTLPAGRPAKGAAPELRRAFSAVLGALPGSRVVSYANTGDPRLIGSDGGTTLGLVFAGTPADGGPPGMGLGESPDVRAPITAAMRPHLPPGTGVTFTGLNALSPAVDAGGLDVGTKLVVGVVAALVVLLLVFRSMLALVPLLISVVAIGVSLGTLLLLSFVMTVHDVALTTMPLLGLGIAVDYSLLIVARWREEQARGHRGDAAVRLAMAGAGRAVLFSGAVVAAGLITMVALPVPFLRSLGLAGMVIAAVSVAVTLTVLPVLLARAGERLDRRVARGVARRAARRAAGSRPSGRLGGLGRASSGGRLGGLGHASSGGRFGREARAGRLWSGWARRVVRHRHLALLASGGLLLVLAVTATQIDLGQPESRHLVTGQGSPATAEASPSASATVTEASPSASVAEPSPSASVAEPSPSASVAEASHPRAAAGAALAALGRAGFPAGVITPFDVLVTGDPGPAAERIRRVPGVHAVLAPDEPAWRTRGTSLLTVLPAEETGGRAGEAVIARVRAAVPDGARVGGAAAQSIDQREQAYGAFPWMLAMIALVTFVLLARAFRSIVLPLKAIALNLLSLGAVIGAMVLLWQYGWGTEQLFGLPPTGSVGEYVPLTIFAFLYGLSMDYEVFILARMREEYDRTGSTVQAIVEGVGRTGRLVSSAALILCISFASLAMTPELDVKVFASGVALGVALDATLIRAVLVPAAVAVMGSWNWWLPGWAARVLRVPAAKEPTRAAVPEPAGNRA
ncbi:MMPL family transporter [Nonomuraea sp. NN258]|uniref:MMPL family transporter n=1 Tax=Nonomuraea antri TaxID=2730852 RepID=UPI00156A2492|nr:MMPL family transporter [Nonomuraea antri]NRQ37610.1 MMPL family transporter [Nonomuraea antri]